MIETDNGRALVHPQLPEPEAIQEDPVVIRISDLETSPGKLVYFSCSLYVPLNLVERERSVSVYSTMVRLVFKCIAKVVPFKLELNALEGHRPLLLGGHVESQEDKKLCFCTASLAQTRIQCEACRAKTKLFILPRLNVAAK